MGYALTLGRPLEVETVVVTASPGAQPGVLLTGSGYVVTRHKYITIGTKILGQIIEEPIEEGQHVKTGDLLARIDDRDYRAQLYQAIADRDLAVANVISSRTRRSVSASCMRAARPRTINSTSRRMPSRSRDAQLTHAEAAIDFAKFNVSQCYITSPINGIVLNKYREHGDTINYGGDIQAGGGATDIAQLADTGDMRAEVDINESDIAKVDARERRQASYPTLTRTSSFDANLVKIYPEADRQKGTVKVEVRLNHPDMAIVKPEMSVRVNFSTGATRADQRPTLLVPKKAIMTEGDASYVWTIRDGAAERVPIKRGRELEDGVEVREGLSDGDLVIVEPPPGLKAGEKVVAKPA